MRRRRVFAPAAALAMLVGIAAPASGEVPVEGPVQVNVVAGSGNVVGDAANEPTLAVDPSAPDRMVAAWRQFDDAGATLRTAGWATSVDGGRSWTFRGAVEPDVFSSDPVLAADSDGRFYLLGLDDGYVSCRLNVSDDGGRSWEPAIPARGGDKPWLAVDRDRRHVYVNWDSSYSCCGSSSFARSIDAGETFEEAVEIDPAPALGTIAVGPDGEVYVSGILDVATFAVARSDDARDPGVTPTFTVTEADLGGSFGFLEEPNPEGLAGMPWVVVGRAVGPQRAPVYLLASVDPPGADPLDVHLVRSDDGGATWSEPVVVNAPDGQDGSGSGRSTRRRTAGSTWSGTTHPTSTIPADSSHVLVVRRSRIDLVASDRRRAGVRQPRRLARRATPARRLHSPPFRRRWRGPRLRGDLQRRAGYLLAPNRATGLQPQRHRRPRRHRGGRAPTATATARPTRARSPPAPRPTAMATASRTDASRFPAVSAAGEYLSLRHRWRYRGVTENPSRKSKVGRHRTSPRFLCRTSESRTSPWLLLRRFVTAA